MLLGAFDDLQFPGAGLGDERGHYRSLIGAIGEDDLDERKQAAGPAQQQTRAVAILHVGRMDHDVQEEAALRQALRGIDEDMPLAARDLLARIPRVRPLAGPRTGSALRVDRRPPFCAALALWLSMIAAEGLASRPSFSRSAT